MSGSSKGRVRYGDVPVGGRILWIGTVMVKGEEEWPYGEPRQVICEPENPDSGVEPIYFKPDFMVELAS